MSAQNEATPRVFLIRHGETEWSKNGRYTGITDLSLLPEGVEKVQQTASVAFGPGRLIDPSKIGLVICSPRKRAQQTLSLYLDQTAKFCSSSPSSSSEDGATAAAVRTGLESKTTTTEDMAEWGYGDYEGLLTHEIRDLRRSRGLDTTRPWNCMLDGCEGPGSEAPADVMRRIDRVIARVTHMQKDALDQGRPCDVVLIAHGHIFRAFVKRWLGFALDDPVKLDFQFEPGSVCGLSYANRNVEDRVLLAGMRLPVPFSPSTSSSSSS
ncbi:hypothetical protein RBB50_002113 [Rhinocladiella similis]